MKITPEEKKLLVMFSGAIAGTLGLPDAAAIQITSYMLGRFISDFDQHASERRAEIAAAVAEDAAEPLHG